MENNAILEVRSLRKQYPEVLAVDDVSFSIRPGICFGLLGPNGAGKTTTIEMIEGIHDPDEGEILFKGMKTGRHFKEKIGIQFQHTALQEFLTVKETLQLFEKFYPNPMPLDEIIEICSLGDIIGRDNRKLSGGQRQRLLLAIALVNDPELLFLDEPTTGLDPQARRNFWGLIENIKAQNKTVILTTHYMDEAEVLCDEIAIMDHGKIIALDKPKNLLKSNFDGVMIHVPMPEDGDISMLPFETDLCNEFFCFSTSDVHGAIETLLKHDFHLAGIQIDEPNLDDLFIKLTGSSLRS